MTLHQVSVFSGPKPPVIGMAAGFLHIWFEKGTQNVWLDCSATMGWVLWEKGRSIADCIANPVVRYG